MALDFGAVGKGFAADRAIGSLLNAGLTSCMIEFGGEIVACNPPPDSPPQARGWTIALPHGETLVLANAALATSGDAEQAIELDGIRYAHILDPRTGSPVLGPIEASVIAPLGALADPLASAVCVLGTEGLRRVQPSGGWAARLSTPDGQVRTIGRWSAYSVVDRDRADALPTAR
jgi:thiamine biosynthesis lipoprotein